MLILNPWGFDVSDLSPDTRASVHLSAFPRLCTRLLGMFCPNIGSEAVMRSPRPVLQHGPVPGRAFPSSCPLCNSWVFGKRRIPAGGLEHRHNLRRSLKPTDVFRELRLIL